MTGLSLKQSLVMGYRPVSESGVDQPQPITVVESGEVGFRGGLWDAVTRSKGIRSRCLVPLVEASVQVLVISSRNFQEIQAHLLASLV